MVFSWCSIEDKIRLDAALGGSVSKTTKEIARDQNMQMRKWEHNHPYTMPGNATCV